MKTIEEIKAEIAKIQKYQEECEALIDTSDNPAIERLNLAQIEGCEDKIASLKWVLGGGQGVGFMNDILNIELKLLEKEQKIILVCSETGRQIGVQLSTEVLSVYDNLTQVTAVFNILPSVDE